MATGITVQYDVAATRGADSVLASDCRAQFNKEKMSHLCDSTVAGPTARRQCTITHKMTTELIRKQFRFGNSFTEITE